MQIIKMQFGFPWGLSGIQNPPANSGDNDLIPGKIKGSSGGGNGNPFQYSCLENPMDRRIWQATVHRVTKSWTRLKLFSTHAHILKIIWTIGNYSMQPLNKVLLY